MVSRRCPTRDELNSSTSIIILVKKNDAFYSQVRGTSQSNWMRMDGMDSVEIETIVGGVDKKNRMDRMDERTAPRTRTGGDEGWTT
jgi:hypothetical protein